MHWGSKSVPNKNYFLAIGACPHTKDVVICKNARTNFTFPLFVERNPEVVSS